MVIKKISFLLVLFFVLMQFFAIQHNISHIENNLVIAHCADDNQEQDNKVNHCDNCHVFNQLAYAQLNDSEYDFYHATKSEINNSYRLFSYTHFLTSNSARAPPFTS